MSEHFPEAQSALEPQGAPSAQPGVQPGALATISSHAIPRATVSVHRATTTGGTLGRRVCARGCRTTVRNAISGGTIQTRCAVGTKSAEGTASRSAAHVGGEVAGPSDASSARPAVGARFATTGFRASWRSALVRHWVAVPGGALGARGATSSRTADSSGAGRRCALVARIAVARSAGGVARAGVPNSAGTILLTRERCALLLLAVAGEALGARRAVVADGTGTCFRAIR